MSDILVAKGGTIALAEIPECHGIEDILRNRAVSQQVVDKLNKTFQWWKDYAERHRCELNNNLSPGNIRGGISESDHREESWCSNKSRDHTTYQCCGIRGIHNQGFVLMNTPGFDPVSVTGLVAGGCNLITFTTGRGSVYGCSVAPTVKVATTSELFQRMRGDMDFDAGRALQQESIIETGRQLYRYLIEVASGTPTASEKLGVGWEEFVPWSLGETL